MTCNQSSCSGHAWRNILDLIDVAGGALMRRESGPYQILVGVKLGVTSITFQTKVWSSCRWGRKLSQNLKR